MDNIIDIESEKILIGSLLIDPNAIEKIVDIVNDNDFYLAAHKTVFRHIIKLYHDGNQVDTATLSASLKRTGEFNGIGMDYIMDCVTNTPFSWHAESYANVVKKNSIARSLVSAANDAIKAIKDDDDIMTVADSVTQKFINITSTTKGSEIHIKDSINDALQRIHDVTDGKIDDGLKTGITYLDNANLTLREGDVMVIGARASAGKSALALSIAKNVALKNKNVMFFSLEMSHTQLAERLVSMITGVALAKIRHGGVSQAEMDTIDKSADTINKLGIIFDDSPNMTIMDIRRQVRKVNAKDKLSLVIIDYLGLIRPTKQTGNIVTELADISRSIKLIAKETNIPVILLAQLNRNVELRDNKSIQLSDLRDSGAIEADADIILAINKNLPDLQKGEDQDEVALEIIKNRSGACGVASAIFKKNTTEFV